jgi:hypothetical protein
VNATENSRWFQPVPAYRIAAFRVAVALTTIDFHVHHFDQYFREYLRSSFHYPLYPWVPSLSLYAAIPLFFARGVAAWFLLFGFYPRLSAALLAASGFYGILVDGLYYSHNTHLHLLLLALLSCSDDRVNLWQLIQPDEGQAVTLAWPERLVVLQLCIVFFFTTLDKIGNPAWGTSGGMIMQLDTLDRGHPFAWTHDLNQTILRSIPGVLSVATIILEFIVAVTLLFQPLWRVAIPLVIAFMMWLEFLLQPDLFPWDVTAIMLLLLPAGDRAYTVRCDGESAGGLWMRRIVSRLDWLRRLRWESAELASQEALVLISPTGKTRRGFDAARMLLLLLPGPLLALFIIVRFGGFGTRILDVVSAYNAVFLMLAGLLLLWVPGFSRFVGQPLYARCSAWLSRRLPVGP